ncbi:MAG: 23S rRNA (cytosine(1962)-C(5))-methyltransferase RlmI [Chloroflexi bacterium]|nr:MAG: 23S rRNA (cytosine(1962)-C(5))-methyltransferase RlmI [Chloroflexota bacterium]
MTNGGVSGTVVLKRNRARPVLQRHPWIFSGAIERIEGEVSEGNVVEVRDAGRNWLARGYLNRRSQIAVRLLTWQQDEPVDRAFWRRRLARAVAARQTLADDPTTTAYRLVHAESDYLPGLVVDRYSEWLVVQFLTLGVERWRDEIVATLVDLLAPRGIYERSDVEARTKEGLEQRTGSLWGEEPPELIEVLENGHRFLVDIRRGHKTGFYLDQRENRGRLPAFCNEAEVLDVFAYSGAFGVHAAAGGAAQVTLVESSAPALDLAQRNFALNGFEHRSVEYVEGDVFSVLRGYRAQGRKFDVVVLDPPKFARSEREVKRAARAYKDVNLLAFQLLRPGGVLFTCSCSGAVSADLFQKIVFGAAVDAERDAQIVGHLAQGSDHPVALTFPEGAYLKGLICRVW